jgi:type III secretion protein D
VLLAAVWFGVGLVQTPSEASAVPLSQERLASDLRTSLVQAGQRALEVHVVAGGLEISGLAESREDARAVRHLLSALPGEVATLAHFAVAQELSETLRNTIGIPGAKVQHLGGGVFSVDAEVNDFAAARASIDRVVADLAPHVKRVEFVEKGAGQRFNGQPVTAAYSDAHTSIVQTRDGAIHLVVTSPDNAATAASRAPRR